MSIAWLIVLHHCIFQGMFLAKNYRLKRRLGGPIRGGNLEANLAITLFVVFMLTTLYIAINDPGATGDIIIPEALTHTGALALLVGSLLLAWAALKDLGDSWRVGVLDEQNTELIERGVYRFSRNPFFVAYLMMFGGYGLILYSPVLLSLLLVCLAAVHAMILKEERYLSSTHGNVYEAYRQRVPRYLGF